MTLLLPTVFNGTDTLKCPLLLIQHDLSQSPFPLSRQIISESAGSVVLVRALYPTSAFVDSANDRVIDINTLNYEDNWIDSSKDDVLKRCMDVITTGPTGPLTVLIDSLDTISEDLGSLARAVRFVRDILASLKSRPSPTRLVLPLLAPSRMASQLASFHPRIELRLHTPALLAHIERELLTPPSNPRFWTLISPLAARREGEKLALGAPNVHGEVVVEVVCPSRRGVLRTIELWHDGRTRQVDTVDKAVVAKEPPDAQIVGGLSFNLSLTEEQQTARSRVNLPYAHTSQTLSTQSGEIIYDPDSADDFDEEDPDDDLDL